MNRHPPHPSNGPPEDTDLVIVGAGAAGLMAAVQAGERGLRTLLIERKHLPGRKLLMCGNARCNLTSNLSPAAMTAAYGPPVSHFLEHAIAGFPPRALRAWFATRGLKTVAHQDGRVFPATEKATDVLHVFNDELRRLALPVVLNAPVTDLTRAGTRWRIATPHFRVQARAVLLATGGVSYPKTGSVGDGQKFASQLGLKLQPYRPGLVGYEVAESWLTRFPDCGFPAVSLSILDQHGRIIGTTQGELRCERWGLTGPAIVNASRLAARANTQAATFIVDLAPGLKAAELAQRLRSAPGKHPLSGAAAFLRMAGVAPGLADAFVEHALAGHATTRREKPHRDPSGTMKHWILTPRKSRSLKEAMVTVGGVDLPEIDPASMQARRFPGLFFAGEVMDIDGPTGGFNLQAAFSSATLAVQAAQVFVNRQADPGNNPLLER